MTYPNQPQYPAYPQQPAAQPAYPPAQPAYPPQQPQYPVQQPGYPPQGQQAPPPPAPKATMADYLEQPAMSGTSLSFPGPGTRHSGIVARDLGDGDFPVQTDQQGQVRTFRDKRPMVVMVVPLIVRPDPEHPDGRASLWVKGQLAEAMKQAMSTAGAGHLGGIPEAGAEITVTCVAEKPAKTRGYNPQKIYEVVYKRPAGAAAAPQANGQAATPQQEQPPWTPQQEAGLGITYPGVPSGYEQPQWQPAPPPAPAQFDGAPLQGQVAAVQSALNNPDPSQLMNLASAPQQAPQAQFQPPAPPQQGPPPPQVPATGMAGPGAQVAAATQAAMQAGQQYAPPQAPAPAQPAMAPPPGMHPYTAALMKQATGQQLTAEDQAALAAGPPQ